MRALALALAFACGLGDGTFRPFAAALAAALLSRLASLGRLARIASRLASWLASRLAFLCWPFCAGLSGQAFLGRPLSAGLSW
jgi:hypothetical protein